MQYRNIILKKVKKLHWQGIESFKQKISGYDKGSLCRIKSIEEILSWLEISSKDYEESLSIYDDSDFQIH